MLDHLGKWEPTEQLAYTMMLIIINYDVLTFAARGSSSYLAWKHAND